MNEMNSTTPSGSQPQSSKPAPKRGKFRIVARIAIVLVLLLIVGAAGLYFYRNRLIVWQVETQTRASTNLATDLDGASLALFGGKLDLNGFRLGSPQGFAAPTMLSLEGAQLRVSYSELRQDPIRMSSIILDRPKLVIERSNEGSFNFKAAADQMPKTDAPADPNVEPVKLVINDLTIREASVVVRPNFPGIAQEITLAIPTITMKNIGSGEGAENGAAIKDVVMQVVTVLAAKASESDQLSDQLKQLMKVNVDQAVAQLGKEAQREIVKALPGPLGESIGRVVSDPAALKDSDALKEKLANELGNVLGGGSTTQPANPAGQLLGDALKGALDRDKEKDAQKEKERQRKREERTTPSN